MGMSVRPLVAALAFAATPVWAIEARCSGEGWTLELTGGQARFVFPSPTNMDVPSIVDAEGADWPKALTLIGDRDTGILILHNRACDGGTHEAQMLTQRTQTPILLQGCCRDVTP